MDHMLSISFQMLSFLLPLVNQFSLVQLSLMFFQIIHFLQKFLFPIDLFLKNYLQELYFLQLLASSQLQLRMQIQYYYLEYLLRSHHDVLPQQHQYYLSRFQLFLLFSIFLLYPIVLCQLL